MTDKDMEVALGVFHQFEEIKGDFNECAEIRGRNIKRIAAAIREAETEALERAEQEAGIMTREEAGDIPDGDGWKAYVKSRKDACARIRALKSKSE